MIQWCEHKHFMCEVYGESVMDEWTLLKFLTVDQLSKHRKSGPACKCLKGIHLQLVLKMKSVSRTSWSHFQNVGWLNDLNSHSISKLITLTQWNAWVMMSVSMSWTQSIQNFGREQTSLFKYFLKVHECSTLDNEHKHFNESTNCTTWLTRVQCKVRRVE